MTPLRHIIWGNTLPGPIGDISHPPSYTKIHPPNHFYHKINVTIVNMTPLQQMIWGNTLPGPIGDISHLRSYVNPAKIHPPTPFCPERSSPRKSTHLFPLEILLKSIVNAVFVFPLRHLKIKVNPSKSSKVISYFLSRVDGLYDTDSSISPYCVTHLHTELNSEHTLYIAPKEPNLSEESDSPSVL